MTDLWIRPWVNGVCASMFQFQFGSAVMRRQQLPSPSKTLRYMNINSTTSANTNTTHFITLLYQGRLGNRMFQYAALLGLARRTRRRPIVDCDGLLSTMYPPIAAECITGAAQRFTKLSTADTINNLKLKEKRPVTSHIAQVVNSTHKYITLQGFFGSWRYFQNVSHTLRQRFQFDAKVTRLAKEFMTSIITRYKHTANATDKVTPIALHVRRGDFLHNGSVATGRQVATADYFYAAMNYFRSQYANCLFLVVSDDVEWCREHLLLLAQDVILVADHKFASRSKFRDTVERDVSVLRLVEHSILSTGTFSWWIGWFTPGQVVYYSKPRANRAVEEHYLPHWKRMM